VAELGGRLVTARSEVIAALQPAFAARAAELGLDSATLSYDGEPPTIDALDARLDRDLERGATGIGPHLDDIEVRAGERDLRSFGSQGEQRLAVLALLLAEAELVTQRRGFAPLLLLDDVLSELDPERRLILAGQLRSFGQTLITATTESALPADAQQVIQVEPSEAGTVAA
jgi:DNA replication and repair protein RecF